MDKQYKEFEQPTEMSLQNLSSDIFGSHPINWTITLSPVPQ